MTTTVTGATMSDWANRQGVTESDWNAANNFVMDIAQILGIEPDIVEASDVKRLHAALLSVASVPRNSLQVSDYAGFRKCVELAKEALPDG